MYILYESAKGQLEKGGSSATIAAQFNRMKHALTILLLMIMCNAVLSCGPTSILLVNLKTNDLRYCPAREEDRDACVKRLEEVGYIRADRLTPEQKASLGLSLPY